MAKERKEKKSKKEKTEKKEKKDKKERSKKRKREEENDDALYCLRFVRDIFTFQTDKKIEEIITESERRRFEGCYAEYNGE